MMNRSLTFTFALGALLAGAVLAEDPKKQESEEARRERELIRPLMESDPNDPAQQMVELFHRVERNLVEIDGLLYDASAGEGSAADAARDSGMGELLRDGVDRGESALQAIDEILKLAQDQGGSCGSCMKPKEQGGGQSPLDQQGQNEPQQREQTPETPQGEQQDPRQQQTNQQQNPKPESGGRDPDDPAENEAAQPPTPRAIERGAPAQGQDDWGDLPQHVREVFRTEGGADLPPQYRDWIESYYKRLNQRRER